MTNVSFVHQFRYPEVLFMDSTYQLNAENYPLYMVAAQDSSGQHYDYYKYGCQ